MLNEKDHHTMGSEVEKVRIGFFFIVFVFLISNKTKD